MLDKLSNPNVLSMVGEKILHTLVNFVVIALLARNLGPEAFGTFGLVQAVFIVGFHVALFCSEQSVIKFTLLDSVCTKKLYRKIVVLKYGASFAVYLLSVAASGYFYGTEFATLAAVYCCMHLVNLDKIYFSYFRSLERGLLVFLARASIYLPLAIVKVVIVINYSSLTLLAFAYVAEALLLSVVGYYFYQRNVRGSSRVNENVDSHSAVALGYTQLIEASWPIFGSALLITLYSRIDQFMIKSMLGAEELGIYTTAVKVSEASTYVITTVIASRFPQLMKLRNTNLEKFEQEIVFLLKIALIFSLLFFAVFSIGAEFIVVLLFGEEYIAASQPLVIHMAGTLFIYYGVICTQYLIAKDLEIFRLYRVLWGLGINVVLNIILIPEYGLVGAAVATLFSQALSSILFNAMSSKTRGIFRLQIQSFAIWRYGRGEAK